ncbi:glutamine amidotransferase [Sulfurifustis variabilis]|uniref:Glutamine amidotransferase n=1 Tax=Sulfurifustis variabilis TaxID=1675686 RepID=A0A1B4V6B1_9GAMM|nr:type 1 glutamine amidotransferase [Sulfurifustis variabilis]BAU49028.1 glutamine amidotransferase [Sulfurifustis variabilis]
MKPVAIFRHAAHEGPGYLAEFLDRRAIPRVLVRIDQNDAVPSSVDRFSGLVFMGGPMSVNDSLPWIPKALALIGRAVEADVPVLGHCLGGQLMARALGATVTRNPVREIGWFPVTAVDGPAALEWLDGLPREFPMFHWHGETFALPQGAVRLLASAACSNQAFVRGPHLGLQCHVEMTPSMIADWVRESDGELESAATVQSGEEMLRDAPARTQALHRVADVLYGRWVQGLA